MNAQRIFSTMLGFLVVGGAVIGAAGLRLKHPVRPIQPVYPRQEGHAGIFAGTWGGNAQASTLKSFTATLHGGETEKFTLGPCALLGGYVVDVTPLEGSVDGAHVEQQVLPEHDGEWWVDVLTLKIPERVSPLSVRVDVYSTAGWPRAFEQTLSLNPGDWQGYIIQEAAVTAGYVIEINPLSAGEFGDRIEKALVQPEFPPSTWWDVLRIQIPGEQAPLNVEVLVYQTPTYLPVSTQYELLAEPGVWYGMGLGPSSDKTAYIVDVSPRVNEDNQVERYAVQPEFDGRQWNDVVRVMIPADRPPMELQVTVYRWEGKGD